MSNLESRQREQRLSDESKPSSWSHGDHINPLMLIEAAGQFVEDTVSHVHSFQMACRLLKDHVKRAATIAFSGESYVVLIQSTNEENVKIARETKNNLQKLFGYCESCADAALQWFVTPRRLR